MSNRAKLVLERLGVSDRNGLESVTVDDLLETRSCGEKTASEVLSLQEKLLLGSLNDPAVTVKSSGKIMIETDASTDKSDSLELMISTANLSARARRALKRLRVRDVSDIDGLTKEKLLNTPYCGLTTIEQILALQSRLKSGISSTHDSIDCANNETEQGVAESYEQNQVINRIDTDNPAEWLIQWIKEISGSERDNRVFTLCMGMDGCKPITKAEIARQFEISRERARQLVKRVEKRIKKTPRLMQLHPIREELRQYVIGCGGTVSLEKALQGVFCIGRDGDKLKHATGLLKLLLSLKDWQKQGLALLDKRFVLVSGQDINLSELLEPIQRIAMTAADDKQTQDLWSIDFELFRNQIDKYLQDNPLGNSITRISNAVLCDILEKSSDRLVKHGNRVYSVNLWKLKFGSVLECIEIVLLEIGKPAHFTEIGSNIRFWRPDFTDKRTHSSLVRSDVAMLWDRGTFIHKSLVQVPLSLITDVIDWLQELLDNDLPMISIRGALLKYLTRCKAVGINSESALYTCLREYQPQSLVLPRLPFVYLSSSFSRRLPMTLEIELFIRDAGGRISLEEIKAFWLDRVYLKDYQLIQYLTLASNILKTGNGMYIHVENLELDRGFVDSLLAYSAGVLKKERHCSIHKIFLEKQVTCITAGIDDAQMLYSLFECFADGTISISGFPVLSISSEENLTEVKTIQGKLIEYILGRNCPCTFEEMEDRFVHELGYNERSIYAIVQHPDVLQYHPGCVVLRRMLEWNSDKQKMLEEIAWHHYQQARASGEKFSRISILVESSDLPKLPEGYHWSKTLIAELLQRGGNFYILGNAREAVIPKDNADNISCFESLIAVLLQEKFRGGSNHLEFQQYLVETGLIKKHLTRSMLGDGKMITLQNSEIYLTGLINA